MAEQPELCGQITRSGKPCQSPAGHGTDHPGTGACHQHERKPDDATNGTTRPQSYPRTRPLDEARPATAANVRRAAELMAEGRSVEDVAVTLRVAPSTVRDWLAYRPELTQMVSELTRQRQVAFAASIAADLGPLKARAMQIINDPETPGGVALKGIRDLVTLMMQTEGHTDVKRKLDEILRFIHTDDDTDEQPDGQP